MGASNLHLAWSELFARALARAGVRHAVISPGSRSTPLVLGLLRERAIQPHSVIDERSAGFYALAIAKLTGQPALVVCTSGTAAAHYLPAVMEASLSHAPLVVLTADRPWDAYDCAAPQTVDQVKLYGSFVRHYAELGLPDEEVFSAVVRVATQSVARAIGPDPGPVHVNARFRKPLEPQPVQGAERWEPAFEAALARVPKVLTASESTVSEESVAALGLSAVPNVMVACGPSLEHRDARDAVRLLAACHELSVPVLAEATSGARFAGALGPNAVEPPPVLRAVDALLSSSAWRTDGPSVVLEVGAPMVSTAYARWASDPSCNVDRVVFSRRGWNDAANTASYVIDAHPTQWLEAWVRADKTSRDEGARERRQRWTRRWLAADARAQLAARKELATDTLTEASALAALHRALPPDSALFVGNSSAVRDIDAFALDPEPRVRVLHQRGASGIDGLVAGAVGARSVSKNPVALALGDVSLWHDIGSLQLAHGVDQPLVIVALQNRGGRIFDRLPLASQPDLRREYEKYFLTDRGVDFEAVTRGFGLAYGRCTTVTSLREELARALKHPGATVIECVCLPGDAERFTAAVRAGARAVDSV
jgi:2-succinyl-5-enolpyruvyl-6-hydroxy-3-cyclohexene-1-carboxylate synthase